MKRLTVFLATVAYVGRIPQGAGTAGSAVAAGLALWAGRPECVLYLFIISTFIGLAICRPSVQLLGSKDPQAFVLDEFAGMLTALLFLPIRWEVVLAAFILFRFFDIVKPLGIRRLDRWDHPMSIMADDLLAGIYTNLILQVGVRLF